MKPLTKRKTMKEPVIRGSENPSTLQPKEKNAYFTLMTAFKAIAEQNEWDALTVNAFAIGMCRTSMQDIVGKEKAEELDVEWRQAVGWA